MKITHPEFVNVYKEKELINFENYIQHHENFENI